MPGVSQYPTFTESSLLRALRQQGFVVSKSKDGYIAKDTKGNAVAFHSTSFTDRSGARYKNAIRELARIGFLPPDVWKRQQQEAKATKAKAPTPVAPQPEPALPLPQPDESDRRSHPCDLCAEQRCRICEHLPLPCAFPLAINLGRHRTAIHGTAPKSKPRPPKAKTPVTTRVDPAVITDPITRLLTEIDELRQQLEAKETELAELAKFVRSENKHLRSFKERVEKQAGALFDEVTAPNHTK